MIFPPPLHHKVLDGSKTEHRIPRTGDDPPHKPGDVLPVKKDAHGEWLGRVVLRSIEPALLNEATTVDARREGFKRLDQMLINYETRTLTFDPEHAQKVWVVRFELDRTERSTFLTATAHASPGSDYSTHRVGDQVEDTLLSIGSEEATAEAARRAAGRARAIDPLDAGQVPPAFEVALYAARAEREREAEKSAEKAARDRMPLPERLARVLQAADEKGIPTDRARASIITRIESLERRVERGTS